jgi:hypothetical protein
VNDPDGSRVRARKDRYAGECIDCGGPTDGNKGPSNPPPTRCSPCFTAHLHDTRRWTPQTIVAALRAWTARHGRQPTAADWAVVGEHRGEYPPTSTVQHEFGSWDAAIRAAGLPSASRFKGIDGAEVVALFEGGLSRNAIAARFDVDPATVSYHLRRAAA